MKPLITIKNVGLKIGHEENDYLLKVWSAVLIKPMMRLKNLKSQINPGNPMNTSMKAFLTSSRMPTFKRLG